MRDDVLDIRNGKTPLTTQVALSLTSQDMREIRVYNGLNKPVAGCMFASLEKLCNNKFAITPKECAWAFNKKSNCVCDRSTNILYIILLIFGFMAISCLSVFVTDALVLCFNSLVLVAQIIGTLYILNDSGDFLSIKYKDITISQTFINYKSHAFNYSELIEVKRNKDTVSIISNRYEIEIPYVLPQELLDYVNARINNERGDTL